ncbi:methylated-DNA--[protein]-cysteine S-methyltransferase [Gracilibacillus salitolerans]|uniref:Methylated-DNA--protein-cysteine methyltransferase n=1 Tax=Gracilibacillus salitolerans TaxID=2663022 RepID=A0A5Q2TIA5_9BACI|nr:methylated-DNA--[protein]-cysteine S-methyltransferase [Gracilibacillus salitolerans]QGH33841.1 methylated-DNA--[protein]-cysteine S-methyltransferase [Gracilibacillus salitolerans]
MNSLNYFPYDSPLGTLLLVSYDQHLIFIKFGTIEEYEQEIIAWAEKHSLPTNLVESKESLTETISQLDQYFKGERKTFSIPYRFYGTPFQKKVWQALAEVEYGKTCSYLDIAKNIDSPKAVRAVGGANNKNPISVIIPCHRVIGKNGKLVGYGGGLDKKEYLLELERAGV